MNTEQKVEKIGKTITYEQNIRNLSVSNVIFHWLERTNIGILY